MSYVIQTDNSTKTLKDWRKGTLQLPIRMILRKDDEGQNQGNRDGIKEADTTDTAKVE